MESDIRKVWRAVRSLINDRYTFAEMMNLVAESGMPVEKLSHLQQKPLHGKGTSKNELFDAIDDLIKKEEKPTQTIQHLFRIILKRFPYFSGEFSQAMQHLGWTVQDDQLRPLDFQIKEASVDLSEEVKQSLQTAYTRYSQDDFSGAMTAVCSALDTLTARVYHCQSLGDPQDATYQERASRSFQAFEKEYRARLTEAGVEEKEVNLIWQNYKGSINQAAYVLGAFRRLRCVPTEHQRRTWSVRVPTKTCSSCH
jgi:hypothetical protein